MRFTQQSTPSRTGGTPKPGCSQCRGKHTRLPFAPQECVAVNGDAHKLCQVCLEYKFVMAFKVAEKTNTPPLMTCSCGKQWTESDWAKCGNTERAKKRTELLFKQALDAMTDLRVCPLCKTPGWSSEMICKDTVCCHPACGLVFCSGCQQHTHQGPCGAPQESPDIASHPDKFFNLDAKIGASAVLRSSEFDSNIKRTDVHLSKRGLVFTLDHFISSQEAEALICAAEEAGFESLERLFPNDYRSNDRLLARSTILAHRLFGRLIRCLRPEDLYRTPMGPTGEGVWLPHSLNEVLKFGRYRPGCFFKAHRDGPWAPSIDLMSVFTIVIYLNGSHCVPFKRQVHGGNTRFFTDDKPPQELGSVEPVGGKAVVFSQDLLHDGATLMSGVKYILRTEVMYRRVPSVLDRSPALLAASEDLKRIAAAYKASNEAMEKGEREKFLAEYLAAIELQAKPRPSYQRLLPEDVMLEVFMYLSDYEILRVLPQLSKWLYRLSCDNNMWRTRMQRRFPIEAAVGPQDLSVNWLQRYRSEVEMKIAKTFPVAVWDVGSLHVKVIRTETRNDKPSCFSSLYRMQTTEFYSHGVRSTYDSFREATQAELNDAMSSESLPIGLLRAANSRGELWQKGAEYLRSTVYYRQGLYHRPLVVVPDDWTLELLANYTCFLSNSALLRFVSFSLAVARSFSISSAVVLALGHSNHCITVVENGVVTRTQRLRKVAPTTPIALRVAKLVHKVLLCKGGSFYPEVGEQQEKAKTLISSLTKDDSLKPLLDQAKKAEQALAAADPNLSSVARASVRHQLIITGGRFLQKPYALWLEDVKKFLLERSPEWKFFISSSPNTDAVKGAVQFGYYGDPLFHNGTAPRPTVLPEFNLEQKHN